MKTIKTSALLILSSIFAVISFSACSSVSNPVEPDQPDLEPPSGQALYPLTDVHVAATGFVSTMHNKKHSLTKPQGSWPRIS